MIATHIFAALTLVADGAFVAVAGWAMAHRSHQLNPLLTPMSLYLTDDTRRLLFVGYIALACAIAASAATPFASGSPPRFSAFFASCFVTAVGMLLPVAVTSRPTVEGDDPRSELAVHVHRYASWLCFVSATSGSLACSFGIYLGGLHRESGLVLLAASGLSGCLCVLTLSYRGPWYGLIQKLLIAALVVWIAVFAIFDIVALHPPMD